MSTTLNETLKHAFDSFDKHDNYSWDDKQEAADKVEILVLQKVIDELNNIFISYNTGYGNRDMKDKISELNNKIKELTK